MINTGSYLPIPADHCSLPVLHIAAQLCCTVHASESAVVHQRVGLHVFGGLLTQPVLAQETML